MSKVKVLIITGFGLNCEKETAHAFEQTGAEPIQIHLNDLLESKRSLDEFKILAFIGGFSYGDHLGAGTVFANKIKFNLRNELNQFVKDGKLIIGICNGFQTLTRLGLTPAINNKYFEQQVALTHNDSNVFRDDWVYLKANKNSPCVFTKGIDMIRFPIRHGEGKFVAEDDILQEIENKNLDVFHYVNSNGECINEFPVNPNGSIKNIAGVCDETGRIFGLMPHPEAFLSPYNSPDWQKEKIEGRLPKKGAGTIIFKNAVAFAEQM